LVDEAHARSIELAYSRSLEDELLGELVKVVEEATCSGISPIRDELT
jgi:hypothetical protein